MSDDLVSLANDRAAILKAARDAEAGPPLLAPPTVDTERAYTTCYTDGSSTGGWGPGGWGWAVLDGPHAGREGTGNSGWTTNQRMELLAAHDAIRSLALGNDELLLIVADSEYVIKGFAEWADGWRAKNFRKVMNADLWMPALDDFAACRGRVKFAWTKGHAGLPGNERADELAGKARDAVPFADWGPKHDPVAYAAYIAPGGRTANGKARR